MSGSPNSSNLKLRLAADFEAASRAAADCVFAELRHRPDALLCLATGASPMRLYELLLDRARTEPGLFSHARFLKLDEWGGLAMDDPASCEVYLQERLIRPLRISPDRYFAWQSHPADPVAECHRVKDWLAVHGPIDVNILGIGTNGHLGLNEPAESLQPGPHVAELAPSSLHHPMLAGLMGTVRYGLTLGMADLHLSRKIVLLASGSTKAGPLRQLFARSITPRFPASFLWLHPDVTVFCDAEAARLLPPATS